MRLPPNSLLILGPTGVGKSDLAVEVAERVHGEIIGADAFQIYQGLDILSAKPSAELRRRVPHHLIGEVPLTASFDVAQYRAMALERANEVASRRGVPIICGGSGMYVRALTRGLADTPPADAELRAQLQSRPLGELIEQLRALDPQSTVDEKNPRRVVRALEVCLLSGRPFSSFRSEWQTDGEFVGVILTRSRETLRARIDARTDAMFGAGVIGEVAAVGVVGPTAAQMLGLREIQMLLAGQLAETECRRRIVQATRQYAKRQLTWFRRETSFRWIDLESDPNPVGVIAQLIASRS